MKTTILIGLLAGLLATGAAQATLYTESFSSVTAIPEGNPVGVTVSGTVSDIPSGLIVGGLTVGLNISGGFNGGLYAYLVAPNGTTVLLMNQPGVSVNGLGASGAGMNITLQDGVTTGGSIQSVTSGSPLSGSYNAAGTLANFNGSAADGTWTLFFAYLANGGGTSTLNSWTLDITAVPEPVILALGCFIGMLLTLAGLRRAWRTGAKCLRLNPGVYRE